MGRGSLVLIDGADLLESMQISAALSMEAFQANLSVIHPAIARARPHGGLTQPRPSEDGYALRIDAMIGFEIIE